MAPTRLNIRIHEFDLGDH